jgi:hypothetical protein
MIPAGNKAKAPRIIEELGLDRLPDARGRIRLLLFPDELRRLVERDQSVLLQAVVPVKPIDKKLVYTDEAFNKMINERLSGGTRKGAR